MKSVVAVAFIVLLNAVLSTCYHRAVICEGSSKRIKCDRGMKIKVVLAFYGRLDRTTCPSSLDKSTTCLSATSSCRIRSTCNGKQSCLVRATNSTFGDPCHGTHKYAKVLYFCEKPTSTPITKIACEGSTLYLSCSVGKIIKLKDGFYGRTTGAYCHGSSTRTTQCKAYDSLKILRSACNGRQSCSVKASNKVFGDPCYGTYKYLQATHYCY